MDTQDGLPQPFEVRLEASRPTEITPEYRAAQRFGRSQQQQRAHLISARNRRYLAQWVRRITKLASDRDPIRRRHDVLLHYRAAAVRTDLLEIAAMLERAHDAEPQCVTALHDLLAHIGDSPLYDSKIPFCELETTLDYIRSGL